MSETPPLFVRVSTPTGHHSVPAAIAARADSSWTVLKQDAVDKNGRLLAPKLRTEISASSPAAKKAARKRAATEPRGATAAATPTKSEASASADSEE